MSDAGRVFLLWASIVAASPVVAAASSSAAEPPVPHGPVTSVQVWLGALHPEDNSWRVTDPANGQNAVGDIGTLPFGGGAGQLLWGDGALQFGYEGGALGSWKSETTAFHGTGNGAEVFIDGEFFMFGVFMGGVLSANLGHNVRLYVAGGPSATWAWLGDNNNDVQVNPLPNSNVIVLGNSESDASFVAYGRAGIEFVLNDGFAFGASVRYADDEFDFGSGGKLRFDEPMWLLTLGAHL